MIHPFLIAWAAAAICGSLQSHYRGSGINLYRSEELELVGVRCLQRVRILRCLNLRVISAAWTFMNLLVSESTVLLRMSQKFEFEWWDLVLYYIRHLDFQSLPRSIYTYSARPRVCAMS
jgi:hypothetical protein